MARMTWCSLVAVGALGVPTAARIAVRQSPAELIYYVSSGGSDATGVPGELRKPYRSPAGAFAAIPQVIRRGSGDHVIQLMDDLRAGLWTELNAPGAAIDIYRRNVQRSYLSTMDDRLNGSSAPGGEVRSLLTGELRALEGEIATALPAVTDESTRRHLMDSHYQIARILDQKITVRPRPQ